MRKRIKNYTVLLLTGMLSASLLAGCGGSAGSPAASEPGSGAAESSSAGAPAQVPAGKDSLTLAASGEPVRFFSCGPDGSNNNDLPVLNNCYDPLVYVNPDGSLSPCLAERWEVSDDGLVYTFHLRNDVKFHDGSILTAEDVAFTYDLCSQNSAGKALLINYDHSNVLDEQTVEIHLSAPYAAFIKGVASRSGYIISKAYYEAVGVDGYLAAPVGTGAYKFVSAVSGDTVTLEAFGDYWGGAPAIKNIYIKTMTDTSTQIIALENGDVDVLLTPSISSCLNLNTAAGVAWDTAESAGRVTLHISTNAGTPGADLNFRKAVQAAVNKQDLIAGAMEGYATQIDIDMCSNYSGYPEGFEIVPWDVDKAKGYLAQSAYNGEAFELLVQSGTTFDTVAQIIQAQLLEIGINCTINAVDTATFTDLWYAGKYGGMIRNTTSSLMDADGFLNFFMATDYAPTNNNQHARTKEIYDLGIRAREVDEAERKALYLEMVNIVTEEAYEVPLFANTNVMAYRSDLSGIEIHPLTYVRFSDWSWK